MAIRAALLVAALMVATGAHAQNKVCVLPARIQSGSASVGGKITQPVDADLKPSGNAPFSGNINIVFPQGSCPDAKSLSGALSNAYLATPKGWSGVSVGASTAAVMMQGADVAKVSVVGLQGDVTSKKGIQSPQVTATAGTVSTQSSLTSINPFPLKGRSMAVSGSGCNLKAQNDQVVFNCPSIQMSNSFSADSGSADLKLSGSLNAVGYLKDAKLVSANDVPKAP